MKDKEIENIELNNLPPILIIDGAYYIAKKSADKVTYQIDFTYSYNGFTNLKDLIIYYNYFNTGKVAV